jgi:hypothetical protein
MSSENVAEPARLTPMAMASVTMWTTASEASTPVAFVTDQVRYTAAVAATSQQATATVMEARRTPWASAVVTAQPISTPTEYVITQKFWAARIHLPIIITPSPIGMTGAAPSKRESRKRAASLILMEMEG